MKVIRNKNHHRNFQDQLVVLPPKLISLHHSKHPLLHAFEHIRYGKLIVIMPDGKRLSFRSQNLGPEADLKLHNLHALDALLARGTIGFSESYMDGEWDTSDLVALCTFAVANSEVLEDYFYGRPIYALWIGLTNIFRYNSISGSRRNIMQHYDLGNAFYQLWLDKSMTYSCGLFGIDRHTSLEAAQQAKYQRILYKLHAKPGDHILEIGCGWGGFAEFAARHGMRVTGVTISEEQKHYADDRLHHAGLDHLAKVMMIDYREIQGKFDHIVSIGMFEHVGEYYWPTYFQAIKEHLKPGGKAMIQTITLDEGAFVRTHGKTGFIDTYIFPGGILPSRPRFREAAAKAGLQCREMFTFGKDYALTLTHWMARFDAHEKEIRALGYDEAFIRMWRMYFATCIATFSMGRTDVMQAELVSAANDSVA